MLSILVSILPVFLLLGIGWLSVRTGYLGPNLADHLNAFAVRLAVPVLLFLAMSRLDVAQAFNVRALTGFYLGGLASFVAGIVIARRFFNRTPGEAVAVGFCGLFSNTVLLGIPIMQRVYGETAMTPVFGIIALHAGVMYTIGMITMEFARADGRSFFDTLAVAARSIISNPLMIGVMGGISLNLSGLELPELVSGPMTMLSQAAIPAALVGLGASLNRYAIRSEFSEALMVSGLSLVLHPLIAFVLTHYLFGLPVEMVRAAVIVAAMPPGLNVYIFAALYNRAVGLSASVIVIATALSLLTISGWIWLLSAL